MCSYWSSGIIYNLHVAIPVAFRMSIGVCSSTLCPHHILYFIIVYHVTHTAEFSAETIKRLLLENRYVVHHWDPDSGIVLNDIQIKTLMSALMNRFQLIQGPPGMHNACECLQPVATQC